MMRPPVVYLAQGERTSPKFCRAFARGCGSHHVTDRPELFDGDVAMFGSPKLWHVLEQAIADGRNTYFGDHGYFGRGNYYRITKNGFQHNGRGDASSERFDSFRLDIKPWRSRGGHILICPPDTVTGILYGFSPEGWLDAVISKIKSVSDRPIRVRQRICATTGVSLSEDFENCWSLVTWRSNAAVEALLEGIPVFPIGNCAASVMGLSDLSKIEKPARPRGRKQFFSNLAANQWTIGEIDNGDAWAVLNKVKHERV